MVFKKLKEYQDIIDQTLDLADDFTTMIEDIDDLTNVIQKGGNFPQERVKGILSATHDQCCSCAYCKLVMFVRKEFLTWKVADDMIEADRELSRALSSLEDAFEACSNKQ